MCQWYDSHVTSLTVSIFVWLSCDCHVTIVCPSSNHHVTVMWLLCTHHPIIIWLWCDYCVPIIQSSCDCHVTIVYPSSNHHLTVMWLLCTHHPIIMWLSCDYCVPIIQSSFDCHVTIVYPSSNHHVTVMWQICTRFSEKHAMLIPVPILQSSNAELDQQTPVTTQPGTQVAQAAKPEQKVTTVTSCRWGDDSANNRADSCQCVWLVKVEMFTCMPNWHPLTPGLCSHRITQPNQHVSVPHYVRMYVRM